MSIHNRRAEPVVFIDRVIAEEFSRHAAEGDDFPVLKALQKHGGDTHEEPFPEDEVAGSVKPEVGFGVLKSLTCEGNARDKVKVIDEAHNATR